MKLNAKLIAILIISLVMPSVFILIVNSLKTEPLPECISVLREEANKVDQKMAMPNSDGGLYLLMQGDKKDRVKFLGYVGPKNVEKVEPSMLDSGLLNVKVKVVGQCETEGGLVYTLVSGHYDVPEPKPDPI